MSVDYDVGMISPVPKLRYNPPRPLWDVFNAPRRKHYNPDYRGPGDPVGHKGVDIGPPLGVVSPWLAPLDAVVHAARWLNDLAGYGVELVYPVQDPWLGLRGLHMAASLLVSVNDRVTQGEKLGTVSNTAIPPTRWVHTHFETRWLRDGYDPTRPLVEQGIPLDPLDFGILLPSTPEVELVEVTVWRPVLRRQWPPYVEDPAVQLLQGILNAEGLLDLKPGLNFEPSTMEWDGKFGPSTEAAVVNYQRMMRLAADGVVGELTWRALLGPRGRR